MPLTRRAWLVAAAAFTLGACGRKPPRGTLLAAGATVLALGDSITFGTGADPDASYPAALAALTGWNVINAGVPGDTSGDALVRLPELLREHAPALVLVSIGGNDFLRRTPDAQTRDNVRRMCELSRAAGAQVLLIGVPRPTLAAAATGALSDHSLYEELAEELKLALHAGGWAAVLGDASLRADAIHANAAGYRRFAAGVAETARAVGWR